MPTSPDVAWQPSLLDFTNEPAFDPDFGSLKRIELDPESWVDFAPGWVSGADRLFADVLESRDWGQRSRHMYDKRVQEPRLTSGWQLSSGFPLLPPILDEMRVALSTRYGVEFDGAGFNLYRDGRDSVAWHRDRIPKEIVKPIVALLSLGEPRKFFLKPYEGGTSKSFLLGHGDLLVTGGETQRRWLHGVPKVKEAGPRISIAFRHDLGRRKYD